MGGFAALSRRATKIKQLGAFSPAISHWEIGQRSEAELQEGLRERPWKVFGVGVGQEVYP